MVKKVLASCRAFLMLKTRAEKIMSYLVKSRTRVTVSRNERDETNICLTNLNLKEGAIKI